MDYEYDYTPTIFNSYYKVNVTITNLTLVNITFKAHPAV